MSRLNMSFRWFGPHDSITLSQIKQIPMTKQIVGMLPDIPVGEVWPTDAIQALKDQINQAGLKFEVVESVNIHDDIKIGLPTRDRYIENYCQTIRNLAACGVKVICYNFMPIFDWIRTNLRYPLSDGSTAMQFKRADLPQDPQALFDQITQSSNHFELPGWEPERLSHLKQLFKAYSNVDEEQLRENLKYFLDAVIPVCEQVGVQMAMHPDDPPMALFGLPRIYKNIEDMRQIESLYSSKMNGFTICTGSLGENPDNDVPAIISEFVSKGKAPFIHLRNIKHDPTHPQDFRESAHESSEGSLDMFAILKALDDNHFDGYVRPDHGRDIWDEHGRPGYGLYDRALGITYLLGLWEGIQKARH
ncbi:mannonate dehydratase [Lactobacillus sp. LC28-10]|uniref:Mannonate dehydratase n=2 Tax=Secundilactobacillus angelensis TaxID=2722706 RepID=A0ABX1KVL6_9LACO|nr:mannonate dehydratase [Secundilactobacillus angelensis]